MYEILDKLLLMVGCVMLYVFHFDTVYAIVPIIITVSASCLFLYLEDNKIKIAGNLAFFILCAFVPAYIIFLPILLYDLFDTKYQISVVIVPLLILLNLNQYHTLLIAFTTVFLMTAFLLKRKTNRLKSLQLEYYNLRDSSASISLLLEEKNRNLLKNQEYEVNLATLNERNRISKELHDSIGHLLSRSLLQVGALLTISNEELTMEGLTALKESLSQGMDQVRNTIHQMHDESIDLFNQIEQIVNNFTFCKVKYMYDIKHQPILSVKHNIIAIVKEALSNIIRHSNATEVTIQLREHPALYQIIMKDNGTLEEVKRNLIRKNVAQNYFPQGMGLGNILERVKEMGGNVNIITEQGFTIFISIPK